MVTGRVWPSRQTRAIAWLSCAGFQLVSNSTSLHAPTRFSPAPPATHESSITRPPRPALKLRTSPDLASGGTRPSNLSVARPSSAHRPAARSRAAENPETTTMRSPSPEEFEAISPRSVLRVASLPEPSTPPLYPDGTLEKSFACRSSASFVELPAKISPSSLSSPSLSPPLSSSFSMRACLLGGDSLSQPPLLPLFDFADVFFTTWSTEFANCLRRPIAHRAAAVDPVEAPAFPSLHPCTIFAPCSYIARCISVGLQKTTISVFAGRCAALMDASRRSTRPAVSLASSLAARCAPATSAEVAFGSLPRWTGAVNLRWNSATGPSSPGHAKSITAAYSSRLFWIGVPVRRTRRGTSTARNAARVCDPC